MLKYKLDPNDTILLGSRKLYRIRAVRSFSNVRIYGDAAVHDDAMISEDAHISGRAVVSDFAEIYGDAIIASSKDYMLFRNN